MKNVQFERTKKALQSKQRDLKRKGIVNKPNASAALSEEDILVLFEIDLLEALLNTVWFNNTIHFGILGCKKHREMCSREDDKIKEKKWRSRCERESNSTKPIKRARALPLHHTLASLLDLSRCF